MHFVSCRHRTSGRVALMNRATRLMRRRTELMFQVVSERRMISESGLPLKKTALADLRSSFEAGNERRDPKALLSTAKARTNAGNRPDRAQYRVKSILNRPGSTFFDESRL